MAAFMGVRRSTGVVVVLCWALVLLSCAGVGSVRTGRRGPPAHSNAKSHLAPAHDKKVAAPTIAAEVVAAPEGDAPLTPAEVEAVGIAPPAAIPPKKMTECEKQCDVQKKMMEAKDSEKNKVKACKDRMEVAVLLDSEFPRAFINEHLVHIVVDTLARKGTSLFVARSTNFGGEKHTFGSSSCGGSEKPQWKVKDGGITKYDMNEVLNQAEDKIPTPEMQRRPHVLILVVNGTDGCLSTEVPKVPSLHIDLATYNWKIVVVAYGKVPINPVTRAKQAAEDAKWGRKYGIPLNTYNTVASKDHTSHEQNKRLVYFEPWEEGQPQADLTTIFRKILKGTCHS